MPDVWTKHPDIVRDLLKDAGFTCGVKGRFLQGRDPAWTCIYDGKTMKGDLYIHHADKLRGELRPPDDGFAASLAPPGGDGITAVAIALLLGLLIGLAVRRRAPSA